MNCIRHYTRLTATAWATCLIVVPGILNATAYSDEHNLPAKNVSLLLGSARREISLINNIPQKHEALMLMSKIYLSRKRNIDALKIAKEVTSDITKVKRSSMELHPGSIASSLALIATQDSLEEALHIADRISNIADYDYVLAEMGTNILESNRPQHALLLLDRIKSKVIRDILASEVAVMMSKNGCYDCGLDVASKIDNLATRDSVYVQMAIVYINRNDIINSGRIAKHIKRPELLSRVLCEIAKNHILAGREQDAIASYDQAVTALGGKIQGNVHLMTVRAMLSNSQQALHDIGRIEEEDIKSKVLFAYCGMLARTGECSMAIDIANTLNDEWSKDLAFADIALQCFLCENCIGSHTITNSIQSSSLRVQTMMDLAKSHLDRCDPKSAEKYIVSAHEDITSIDPGGGTEVIHMSKMSYLLYCCGRRTDSSIAFAKAFSMAMKYDENTAAGLLHDLFEINSPMIYPNYNLFMQCHASVSPYIKSHILLGLAKGLLHKNISLENECRKNNESMQQCKNHTYTHNRLNRHLRNRPPGRRHCKVHAPIRSKKR